jgi:outer membrane DcaP-like protein
MIRLRKFNAAVALGGLSATVALLAGMPDARAQSAPGAGSYPGSILLPGTNTSFKVGGYVKGDYTYDFSSHQDFTAASETSLNPAAIPLDSGPPLTVGGSTAPTAGHSIHGVSRFSAAESRFNIETRTPTSYGELKTLIEADFAGPSGLTPSSGFEVNSNSSGLRIRLAYGTLGPWLVGQFPSLFRDTASEPEGLDFGGPLVAGVLRQPQFRYTYDAGYGLLIAGAVENAQTSFVDARTGAVSTTFGTGQGDKIPDFTGAATWNQPWGHVAIRGVLRDLYDHNGGPGSSGGTSAPGLAVSESQLGWGAGISGHLNTWGKDVLYAQFQGGRGLGRYTNDFSAVNDFVVNPVTNASKDVGVYGGEASYQHWWTDELRTNVTGSYLKLDQPQGIFANTAAGAVGLGAQNNRFWTGLVNLIWSPVPQVDTGIEYINEYRKIQNGRSGVAERLQVSTKFKF